ncbi:hypothetical protein [Mesorhizobium sp. ISC11]|uniref:hypothetical protein n=1 Tax=Mesorhizobium sp. ISC11 TaxID=3076428 RepID=UPI00301D030E
MIGHSIHISSAISRDFLGEGEMDVSRHAQRRMQQRGRRPAEICFVLEHGTHTSAGVMLTGRDAALLEKEARSVIEMAQRLKNVVIPCGGATVKTVFKARPKQQSRIL